MSTLITSRISKKLLVADFEKNLKTSDFRPFSLFLDLIYPHFERTNFFITTQLIWPLLKRCNVSCPSMNKIGAILKAIFEQICLLLIRDNIWDGTFKPFQA